MLCLHRFFSLLSPLCDRWHVLVEVEHGEEGEWRDPGLFYLVDHRRKREEGNAVGFEAVLVGGHLAAKGLEGRFLFSKKYCVGLSSHLPWGVRGCGGEDVGESGTGAEHGDAHARAARFQSQRFKVALDHSKIRLFQFLRIYKYLKWESNNLHARRILTPTRWT